MAKNSPFPKGPISQIQGRCLILTGDDIDTDRIIPARFLRCVSFKLLGDQVFADDRKELKGSHPFDLKSNQGASILIVNKNFGCGSSREHAPQALMRWGIRAIIGQSFAEIFYGNCLAIGIPCLTTESSKINAIAEEIKKTTEECWLLNINKKTFSRSNKKWQLSIDQRSLDMLTSGRWDATSQLISNCSNLKSFMINLPYLNNFSK